jgi:TonB-linked SusC/RagA family outer membrane protein
LFRLIIQNYKIIQMQKLNQLVKTRFFAFLKSKIRLISVFSIMMMSCLQLMAQTQKVTGVVTDGETGDSLPGVTVLEANTSNGSVTDLDGKYSIMVNQGASITYNFVGYVQTTLEVGTQSVIDVKMDVDVMSLDEVVIVDYGYGSVKKTDNTGSVATLSGTELKKIPFSSAAQALSGRLPGVNVLTTDGSPDAEVVIRVRGGGSITQDNSPLYVVDGFIVGSIRDVPPSDIESITVLKDAAATAIYGAQASNGVVVVRTKEPKAGETTISYNAFVQMKTLPGNRRYEVLSPHEYVMANYEYNKLRSESSLRNFERFFGTYEDLELYRFKKATDWQDELFGQTQYSQYHNFSVSGGNENTKISLSLTRNDDDGILVGNGYQRNVANFKLSQKLANRLTFEMQARITNTKVSGAGTAGSAQLSIKDAIQTRPVNGIADELDIDLNAVSSDDDFQAFLLNLVNPTELLKQDWRRRTDNNYVFNAALNWEAIDGLNLKTTLTRSNGFRETLRFYGPLTSESFNNGGNLPLGQKTDRENFSYRWLNTANYSFPMLKGDHDVKVLVGQEIYSSGGKQQFVRSEDFRLSITPEELFANMTFGRTDRHETQDFTNSNRFSLFGRADYQYKNKYIAALTFRSDASSRFGKDNRLGIFPAIALGWKISEEKFLNTKAVDELKLRVSIGTTGNDRISATATQFLFEGSTNKGPGFGNVDNVYYTPEGSTLYNPDLVWETTISRNLGLDFSFFQSKIFGSLDAYANTTKDLLLQSSIPSNTGFRTQWNNIGSTSNKGIELGLTGYIIDKQDLTISVNANFGINRAKIEELDGTNERFFQSNWASTDLNARDDFYLKVGGTIGDVYGYVTDGFYGVGEFQSYDETSGDYILNEGVANTASITGNNNIRPGFLKLKDINGDSLITAEDRQVIGNTLPKAQGGFGFNTSYKGFDASIFFNWSYGNDIYNTGKIQFNQFRRVTFGNMLSTMSSDNRFTYIDEDGSITGTAGEIVTDLAQLGQMNADKNIWSHNSYGGANAIVHSWAIEDGSFIRLNQITIGYTIPSNILDKVGIGSCRFYVTGNNLHVWTKYSGYDPEVSTTRSSGYSALTPGVDYSSYPRNRSYTVGVNVTF